MSKVPFIEIKANPKIPQLAPGDTVRVHSRIVEGEKERIQVFQGVVIRISRGGAGANFTVRRVSHGVGIERTFPLYSPLVEKVEVTRHGKVRRARLYYLRGLSAKKARIKERRVAERPDEELLVADEAEAMAVEDVMTEEAAEVVTAPEVEASGDTGTETVAEAVEVAVNEEPAAEAEAEATAEAEVKAEAEAPAEPEAAEEPVAEVEAPAEEVAAEEPAAEAEAPAEEVAAEEPVAEAEEAAAEEPAAEAEVKAEAEAEPAEEPAAEDEDAEAKPEGA